jgi:hypothetical protein
VATATWDILRVPFAYPSGDTAPNPRDVVFINHANPEDNAFATWLAGQLALLGYSVWSDVTKLVGGETFWNDIEDTIRFKSAKFIAVLSRAARDKPGVLDEIDLAVRTERSNGLTRYVVPVRIDDSSYEDVRANIARKNIIDFTSNWALGLQSVLKVLERDRVPRVVTDSGAALSRWVRDRFSPSSYFVAAPEFLTTNWLPITELPSTLSLYNVSAPIERIDDIARSLTYPTFRYLRLLGSFASASDLQADVPVGFSISAAYRIQFDRFLAGSPPELPGLPKWEASKLATSLLRQSWNLNMKRLGLRPFETASGTLAWYMTSGFLTANRVDYVDSDGKKRRKSLVGWSDRRKVFWHFAVEAKPVLAGIPRYLLKEHVLFTSDGVLPIDSKDRMHLLRRRFCRSWWNDRWRDLLIAFVYWLSQKGECQLAAGSIANFRIQDKLMALNSPISLAEDQDVLPTSNDEEDQLDNVEEEEFYDDGLDIASEAADADGAK